MKRAFCGRRCERAQPGFLRGRGGPYPRFSPTERVTNNVPGVTLWHFICLIHHPMSKHDWWKMTNAFAPWTSLWLLNFQLTKKQWASPACVCIRTGKKKGREKKHVCRKRKAELFFFKHWPRFYLSSRGQNVVPDLIEKGIFLRALVEEKENLLSSEIELWVSDRLTGGQQATCQTHDAVFLVVFFCTHFRMTPTTMWSFFST